VGRENKTGKPATDSREDFLARWSRRKLDGQPAPGNQTDRAAAVTEATPPPADAPEKVLTDADMQPIETLDESSDFSPFLSPGVSDDLRRQALRKLFSQPDFNITDGLNDYDEDFTRFTGLGSAITHEMKRLLQREPEVEKSTSTAPADPDVEADTTLVAEDASGDRHDREARPDEGPEDIDTKRYL